MSINFMENWKNVKEEHPFSEFGESKNVLTVDAYGVMRVLYWDGGNWCWPSGEAVKTTNIAPITHWMDLPNRWCCELKPDEVSYWMPLDDLSIVRQASGFFNAPHMIIVDKEGEQK